jgi:hypothetical protein
MQCKLCNISIFPVIVAFPPYLDHIYIIERQSAPELFLYLSPWFDQETIAVSENKPPQIWLGARLVFTASERQRSGSGGFLRILGLMKNPLAGRRSTETKVGI